MPIQFSASTGNLYPFDSIRGAEKIRIGITTIEEKWSFVKHLPAGLIVPSNLLPVKKLTDLIMSGSYNLDELISSYSLQFPWQIFQWNDQILREDFIKLTEERVSCPIPSFVQAIKKEDIFIEQGAVLQHCILNASAGPIYIGKNTEIMEGSTIRGPFALCEGSVVKMGSRIYGATTVGPYSVVGGEIKNSVIFGYSNKAHDGYIGDTVIGEWCNLGAGSSSSNLKNNASGVRVWNQEEKAFITAGQKCGLLMGDYSRSAINTSFNTGTVVGVAANVFYNGLSPKFIPDFSWGADGERRYTWEKLIVDLSNWKKMKNHSLSDEEVRKLKHIFDRYNEHKIT